MNESSLNIAESPSAALTHSLANKQIHLDTNPQPIHTHWNSQLNMA